MSPFFFPFGRLKQLVLFAYTVKPTFWPIILLHTQYNSLRRAYSSSVMLHIAMIVRKWGILKKLHKYKLKMSFFSSFFFLQPICLLNDNCRNPNLLRVRKTSLTRNKHCGTTCLTLKSSLRLTSC